MKPRFQNPFRRLLRPITSAVFFSATSLTATAASSTWSGATSSDWNVAGNWTNPPAYGSIQTGRLNISNGAASGAVYDPVAQSAVSTTTTFSGTETGQGRGFAIGSGVSGALTINSGSLVIGGTDNPIMSNLGGNAALTINGGSLDLTANPAEFRLVFGGANGVTSAITMNGGSFLGNGFNFFQSGSNNSGTSTVQLSGGTFAVTSFRRDATTGGATSAIRFNGGTLQARGSSATFFPPLFNTTAVVQAGGAKIDTQAFNITISQPLTHDTTLGATPDGGLTKSGSGTLTLGGIHPYTGPTTVNAGTLALGISGSLSASPVNVTSTGTLQVDATGKTLVSLSLANGSTLSLPARADGTTTVTGALALNGGTVSLALSPIGAPPSGSVIDILTAGSITGSATFAPTFTGSRLTGVAALNGSKLQITVSGTTANLVWNNASADNLWNLDASANFKNGAANDVFKNYDTVTFDDTLGAGPHTITVSQTLSPGTITVNNSNGDYLFDGAGGITGSAALIKSGGSNLTFAPTLAYSANGPLTLGGGTVDLGGKTLNGVPSLTLTGGILANGTVNGAAFDIRAGTSSAVLNGSGALTKTTAGTATLNAANTYAGATTLTEGTLVAANATSLGNGATQVNGGTLQIDVATTVRAAMNLGGGALSLKQGSTLTIGSTAVSPSLTFTADTSSLTTHGSGANPILRGYYINTANLAVATGIAGSVPATIDINTYLYGFSFNTAGTGSLTVASAISGAGNANNALGMTGLWVGSDSGVVFKLGTGTLRLTGASTFTAGALAPASTIQAGTLVLSGGNDRLPAGSAVYLGIGTTGAKLVLDGISQTLTGLKNIGTGASSVVASSTTPSTLTLNTMNNYSFSGAIGGTGENENNLALVKSGTGTLALTGATSYKGNTTVNGGTLSMTSGTLDDGSKVTIAAGALLKLDYAGTDTVSQLVIGASVMPAGVYGSTESGAAIPDNAHFSGTGTLTVLPPPSGDFEAWASDKGIPPELAGRGQDADDDGLNNFGEFAFAGNPLSSAPNPRNVTRISTVNSQLVLTLTVPVRNGVLFGGSADLFSTIAVSGVYYRIQGSSDLSNWTTLNVDEVPEADTAAVQTGIPTAPNGWTNRSFYLPGVSPANAAKSFLRAKASESP